MAADPKVSIIVPVHNTEKYLRACLDSIANQTLRDIEIIIVDDGSRDGSSSILSEYARTDERIRVITQQNRGQASARNAGVEHARAEYIGFVDSDDWIDREMFRSLYERAKSVDADVIIGTHELIDRNDNRRGTPQNPERIQAAYDSRSVLSPSELSGWVFSICPVVWDKLYRRSHLLKNRIRFPDGIYYEDVYFVMTSIITSARIAFSNEPHYFYRVYRQGGTTHRDRRMAFDIITTYALLASEVEKRGTDSLVKGFERTAIEKLYEYYTVTDVRHRSQYYSRMRGFFNDTIRIPLDANEYLSGTMRTRAELIRNNPMIRYHLALTPIYLHEQRERWISLLAQTFVRRHPRIHRFLKAQLVDRGLRPKPR